MSNCTIVLPRNKKNETKFGQIEILDTFRIDDKIYMKTNSSQMNPSPDYMNAVCLSQGYKGNTHLFGYSTVVILTQVSITVEDLK